MRFLLPSLLALLPIVSGQLTAQAYYSGQVLNAATRQSISGVEVVAASSQTHTLTALSGDFLLASSDAQIVTDEAWHDFIGNKLRWEGGFHPRVEVYAMDGRQVVATADLGPQGAYLLPQLPVGIYAIIVYAKDQQFNYKAFSNGRVTMVGDQVMPIPSVQDQADVLIFRKEGYFDREVAVNGRDTFLWVNLQPKVVEDVDYFNELVNVAAYDVVSSTPSRSHEGGVRSVKVMYNTRNNLVYYQNTKKYNLHYTFAQRFLGFDRGNSLFNLTQYQEHPDRYLYPANLNYYENQGVYVLHFVSGNEMSCERVKLLYDKIIETSYLEGKLFILANRPAFNACEVPLIKPEVLYEGQNYQALNLTENYGYLRKVEIDDLEQTYLSRREIVLLNGIPNDVSVVAGIITTEFQTPLSHINVLSHNRNTPNMALRDGWSNPLLTNLLDELVYLKVEADSFVLRKATLTEATAFWAKTEPQETIVLEKNTTVTGLVNLYEADYTDVDIIGGKASNFAELLNVFQNGEPIRTPEQAFAIPFYYYERHLEDAGLDTYITTMLADAQFQESPVVRKARLENLRDKIKDHPIDADLVALVRDRINDFADFASIRFRSSTNAEDLPDFSGAGLYNSHSAKRGHSSKTIERAIKKVWASLWNWRAFEERTYYKISHTSCAMGILVHRSFPDEDANGVMITKNLYNQNPGFIINAQYKEESIVFPEPGVLHEQLILFTWSNIPGQPYMPEYLTFSNVPELNGGTVLTHDELMTLGRYGVAIRKYFYENVPHDCNCQIDDFGLDIEFKVDSQVSPRAVYIKQVRYYK